MNFSRTRERVLLAQVLNPPTLTVSFIREDSNKVTVLAQGSYKHIHFQRLLIYGGTVTIELVEGQNLYLSHYSDGTFRAALNAESFDITYYNGQNLLV